MALAYNMRGRAVFRGKGRKGEEKWRSQNPGGRR